MPILSSKRQSSAFDALAAKVEAKKKEEREKQIANEAFKTTFTVKKLEKVKSGLLDPVHNRLPHKKDNVKGNAVEEQQKQEQAEATGGTEGSKLENVKEGDRKSERSSSIVSGSQKIQELQEIQKQLNKSYEPKPLFEPRRPTLESIKSAIEKAKQDEANRNKSVGTEGDDVVTITTTSDASTSIEKFLRRKKKKKKKVSTTDAISGNSAAGASSTSSKNKKRTSTVPGKSTILKAGNISRTSGAAQKKNKRKTSVEVKVKTNVEPSESAGVSSLAK